MECGWSTLIITEISVAVGAGVHILQREHKILA